LGGLDGRPSYGARHRRRLAPLFQWGAAAATAAALYALPWAILAALDTTLGGEWVTPLIVDLAALIVIAVRRWSPLVVLAVALLSIGAAIVAWFVIAAGETCGDSRAATVVEWVGAVPLALALGSWGALRGRRALAAIPAGWLLAGVWVLVIAHVVHGGAGPCFE
jgi:hypothetical protein